MIPAYRPRFEVIVGTATAADRRLVSVATVRALTGITESEAPDAMLELLIDSALAQVARYCKLQRAGARAATFARETVRATWREPHWYWGERYWGWAGRNFPSMILPWRVPISSITITEAEAALVEGTDYVLHGAAVVERLAGAWAWNYAGELVVDYTAGWLPPTDGSYDDGETMPADLVAAIVDQVRYGYSQRSIDPSLRSEDIPGVWSGTYNVPGGDAISDEGLTALARAAFNPYRNPSGLA